jgi:hypothetical protein
MIVRCLRAIVSFFATWNSDTSNAYTKWESRPFPNGDGI